MKHDVQNSHGQIRDGPIDHEFYELKSQIKICNRKNIYELKIEMKYIIITNN